VSVTEQIRAAFETKDLTLLAPLLAEDVRWGDGDQPRACRNRQQVLDTFGGLLGSGVEGEITELAQGDHGILCALTVHWPEGMDRPRHGQLWQVYLLRAGLIAEIRRFDDRPNAAEAAGL